MADEKKGEGDKQLEKQPASKDFIDRMIDDVSDVAKGIAGEGVAWHDPSKQK